MSEDGWIPLFCPNDEGGLKVIAIAEDGRSGIGKCKICGRSWEITTDGGPPVSWQMAPLRRDTK